MNSAAVLSHEEGGIDCQTMERGLSSDYLSVTESSFFRLYPIIFPAVKIQFIDTAWFSGTDASPPAQQSTAQQIAPATTDWQWIFSILPHTSTTRS